ncbi:MAG: metallophosphoesterase family protein [Polyangiales bacterium]
MHRLAVISDVHADVHALEAALSLIERLGCHSIVCAGDLVDYGLFGDETLDLLAARKIPCVRGNHDRWALDGDGHGGGAELSRPSRRFLAALPRSLAMTIEGVRIAVHHASPRGDMDGIDPDETSFALAAEHLRAAAADVLIVGHTHISFALDVEGVGTIHNPAALLRSPASDDDLPRATARFGVLELPTKRFSVYRVADGQEVDIIRRRVTR